MKLPDRSHEPVPDLGGGAARLWASALTGPGDGFGGWFVDPGYLGDRMVWDAGQGVGEPRPGSQRRPGPRRLPRRGPAACPSLRPQARPVGPREPGWRREAAGQPGRRFGIPRPPTERPRLGLPPDPLPAEAAAHRGPTRVPPRACPASRRNTSPPQCKPPGGWRSRSQRRIADSYAPGASTGACPSGRAWQAAERRRCGTAMPDRQHEAPFDDELACQTG